jgi:hypothetical protein
MRTSQADILPTEAINLSLILLLNLITIIKQKKAIADWIKTIHLDMKNKAQFVTGCYKKLPNFCKVGTFTLASALSSGDKTLHETRQFFIQPHR